MKMQWAKCAAANCRHAFPLSAGLRFARAIHSQPCSPAAVSGSSVAAWQQWRISRLIILISSLAVLSLASAAEPPVISIGLDAYRHWERWPYQRIGARAYMRSTYDRRGGNEGADASHFLYQLADDFNVSLDVAGPGVLYFVRCNHWHGSPWHYEVDGKDHIAQETSTADPTKPVEGSVFLPERLFPFPLAVTWSITKGADLMW